MPVSREVEMQKVRVRKKHVCHLLAIEMNECFVNIAKRHAAFGRYFANNVVLEFAVVFQTDPSH